MRLATDTGGTFTDLIVEDDRGELSMYKAATTPDDPIRGVLDVLEVAARDRGSSRQALLRDASVFVHGTTHALNAVVTGSTARTALLTTRGHRDVLVFREGGRPEPFNHTREYPAPYVPRRLTFEIEERVGADGAIVTPLLEASVLGAIERLRELDVEAVAVCLLWSVVEPAHELRIGALLEEQLPGVPYTLSHRLNPVLREYRRASGTAIDASLKPLMTRYIGDLTERLGKAGFGGRVLILTSLGGLVGAREAADAPIALLKSGPSMAPVAGRFFGRREADQADLVVTDAGGTTYDVSLVRGGEIPRSRETWIGEEFLGHVTGFPSVDVKSVGAGGGSVAWVDEGGLLHVGPQSQGADPGPACYGRGGSLPTLTDAAVVLGYIDPDYFLGGRIPLDAAAAVGAVEAGVARPLGLDAAGAAAAVLSVATENMAQAILEITVDRGVDPASAVLVGGGGAAGLNSVAIARRLGCRVLLFPEVGAALSAAGAILSDLVALFSRAAFVSSRDFDRDRANQTLAALEASCRRFAARAGAAPERCAIAYSVEARYENQVWEIEVPLAAVPLRDAGDVARLAEAFHAAHERIFAVADPDSPIEILNWSATATCRVREGEVGRLAADRATRGARSRRIFLPGRGGVQAPVVDLSSLAQEQPADGPAIVESGFTSIVIDEAARYRRSADGTLVVELG